VRSRKETWLAFGVLAIGMIPLGLLGLWAFMSITATVLHPNAADVPSTGASAPFGEWDTAAGQGRQLVRATLAEQNIPGMSVAVGVDGIIVWAEGFGWADLEQRALVTTNTTFAIGTASVPLTSAAVGRLVETGRLRLDADIHAYVPEFPQTLSPVTVRQVLANTAGVPNDGGDEGPLFGQHCERPADAFQFLSGYERERLFEPGTQFRYSSYGWVGVSAAVEAAAKEPFLSFMHREVFEPLGMGQTDADSTADPIASRTTSYFPRFMADPRYGVDLMRPLNLSCYAGAGVFLSTPSDLVRFGMAINDGKLLQPATVELLQASQQLASGADTGYGLGWDLGTVTLDGRQTASAGHGGDLLGGPVASLVTFPEHRMAVAVVANISYADAPGIALRVAQAFVAIHRRP
jgi:serine beta-lactamase-like protein LACTB